MGWWTLPTLLCGIESTGWRGDLEISRKGVDWVSEVDGISHWFLVGGCCADNGGGGLPWGGGVW